MSFAARLFSAVMLVFALAAPGLAREEIRAFSSDVTLRTDGSVRVVETIDVQAEGIDIRRGIYRDIPTVLIGNAGNKIRVDLAVEGVTRAGAPEPYRVERMGNFQRIWIGSSERLLTRGEHRYTVTYVMARMARPFEDHDELYWNATGNYWDFPVLKSMARVTLPPGAVIAGAVAYTGFPGSTEQAVTMTPVSENTAVFRTDRVLGPGEGMTFSVSFQKGIVQYPQGMEALLQSASDLREIWLPVLCVLVLLAYNFTAWLRVGRDPPKGTIVPLFYPPKDFSPALTHYVHKWGFANSGWTAMTAAIFNLGVRGLVTVDNSGDKLSVTATGKQPEGKLPVGEQVLFSYFAHQGTVSVDTANGAALSQKRAEFIAAITAENRRLWFNHNWGFAIFSFVLAALMMGGMVALEILEPVWLFGAFVGGVFVTVIGSIVFGVLRQGGWQRFLIIIFVGFFAFNFLGAMLESFSGVTINTAAIATASLVAISAIFAVLMRAPTVQGRKVMDEIEGFKLYLETAEKNRLNIDKEPPMTIDRFERILPYAIALGVEKPWSEHFEAELARNAVPDATGSFYAPHWYSGTRNFSAGSLSNAISTASSGMAAAMIAAQPVQASSSGFSSGGGGGGGGFSGGGGGGGGGGGW